MKVFCWVLGNNSQWKFKSIFFSFARGSSKANRLNCESRSGRWTKSATFGWKTTISSKGQTGHTGVSIVNDASISPKRVIKSLSFPTQVWLHGSKYLQRAALVLFQIFTAQNTIISFQNLTIMLLQTPS
jgi:hypothetical protein